MFEVQVSIMGYSLWFQNTAMTDNDKTDKTHKTTPIDLAYGFNIYRSIFDPVTCKEKKGSEMVRLIDEALITIQTKYSIRQSSRNLLNPTIGNLELILRNLRAEAETHSDRVFAMD